MKTKSILSALALGSCLLAGGVAVAGPQAKSYQVSGPVMEVTDTAITIKKGEDLWQIARDAGTKIDGDLKVGSRATIHYRMVATDVEVKAEKAEPAKPSKPKATEKK